MNTKQLAQELEELKKRVRDLEARPINYPVYVPVPQTYPIYPAPEWSPWRYEVTCLGGQTIYDAGGHFIGNGPRIS